MKRLFLCALAALFSAVALSDVSSDGKWQYIKWNDDSPYYLKKGEVALYSGTTETGILPSEVDGYSVAAIAQEARIACLTDTLVVPSSVRRICALAFWNKSFQTVVLHEGVETIGENAFGQCRNLESIVLPKSLKCIGTQAFSFCERLNNIDLPTSLEYLGWRVFVATPLEKNEKEDIWIMGDCLVECRNKALETAVVPHNVRLIASGAFNSCTSLLSITIPSSVKRICSGGLDAFLLNDNSHYTNIDSLNTFGNCHRLKQVHVDDLKSFGAISFSFWHANPMNYADELYVGDELVTGTCRVALNDWASENYRDGCVVKYIQDSDQQFCEYYYEGLTLEVPIGRGVVDLDCYGFESYDGAYSFKEWNSNVACVTKDTDVFPVLQTASFEDVERVSSVPYGVASSMDCVVYDPVTDCVHAQGLVRDELVWPFEFMSEVDLDGNLRMEISGIDDSGQEVCSTVCERISTSDGFAWSGDLPIAEHGVTAIDIHLVSTWFRGRGAGECYQLQDLRKRQIVPYAVNFGVLRNADYEIVEDVVQPWNAREVTHEARVDVVGLKSSYALEFDNVRYSDSARGCRVWMSSGWDMEFDLSGHGFRWIIKEDEDPTLVRNFLVEMEEWTGRTGDFYKMKLVVNPDLYTVQFDIGDCGTRVGGGELYQQIDWRNSECEVFPIVETGEHARFLGWKRSEWNGNELRYVAEYDQEYLIEYCDTKGCENLNPMTYRSTNEVVFTPLQDVDGWWFGGWSPAKIEVGSTGDVTVVAMWRPKVISTIAYENLFGAVHHNPSTYLEGCALELSPPSARTGYAFSGWTPPEISAEMTGPQTVRANWTANKYKILYSASGGSGVTEETSCSYDQECAIAKNGFARLGYIFKGWATEENGEVVYEPGQKVTNLAANDGDEVILYAVWEKEKVEDPVIVLSSATISMTESCTVTITCETVGVTIYCRIGAVPRATDEYVYLEPITLTDTATVYAFAKKGDQQSATVTATVAKQMPSLAEAMGALGLSVVTGGVAPWYPVADESVDGDGFSVRSGFMEAADDEKGNESWMEVSVTGAGTLSFWWRVDCEDDGPGMATWDRLVCFADGEECGRIDGQEEWGQKVLSFSTAGEHKVRWVYHKDDYDDQLVVCEDCGWVDGIAWTPSGTPEVKPTIDDDPEATVTGDAETGFVVRPSEGKTVVEVTIPQGEDAAKVTVEVSTKVESVKSNGAKVKIISGGADITEYLVIPGTTRGDDGGVVATQPEGVVDLTKATVKEEIVKEAMDPEKGAVIDLSGGSLGTTSPTITTAPTRVGLFYTFSEGRTLDGMERSAGKPGDGKTWSPEIKIKGGNSAFYSIGVGKGE